MALVGCDSHKFNLFVEGWIWDRALHLKSIKVICQRTSELRTLKYAAPLRKITHLGAFLPSRTCWTANSDVIEWYSKIEEIVQGIPALDQYLFIPVMCQRLMAAVDDLKKSPKYIVPPAGERNNAEWCQIYFWRSLQRPYDDDAIPYCQRWHCEARAVWKGCDLDHRWAWNWPCWRRGQFCSGSQTRCYWKKQQWHRHVQHVLFSTNAIKPSSTQQSQDLGHERELYSGDALCNGAIVQPVPLGSSCASQVDVTTSLWGNSVFEKLIDRCQISSQLRRRWICSRNYVT